MRYQLKKIFKFEAAHRLPLVPEDHKCAKIHGHSYKLTFCVSSDRLVDGMVVDFRNISHVVKSVIIMVLDHETLNEIPGLENPTAENLALYCADVFCHEFRMLYHRPNHPWYKKRKEHFLRLDAVEVQETDTSFCRLELDRHI
jgi:6-pyruvoyltetrahydropterin/6-carboxytetrahydropterin synthase